MRGKGILLLLTFLQLQLHAQQHIVRNYSVQEGLQQSEVAGMVQDESGNLWLATLGGGLCKFNGLDFDCLTERHGLLSNAVTQILRDQRGLIWVAIEEGVCSFNGEQFSCFELEDICPGCSVLCLEELQSGKIVLGTEKGLLQIAGQRIQIAEDALQGIYVRSVMQDDEGQIWIGTNEGIMRFDGRQLSRIELVDGVATGSVMDLLQATDRSIWFGSANGIFRDQGSGFERQSVPYRLASSDLISQMKDLSILSIFEDSNQNIWFGTSGIGVIKWTKSEGSYEIISRLEGLSNNYIYGVFEDREKQIWLCSSGSGIEKLLPSFQYLSEKDGLVSDLIYALEIDSEGRILIGSIQGGFSVVEAGRIRNYTTKDGLIHRTVRCIFRDSQERIWVGTEVGVALFEEGKFVDFSEQLNVKGNAVYAITEDAEQNLWFTVKGEKFLDAGPGGIRKWSSDSLVSYHTAQGLASNYVHTVLADAQGRMWFGTEDGLSLLVNDSFRNYDKSSGLCNKRIYALAEDSLGNIWIGTGSGLSLLTDEGVVCLNDGHFVESEPVYLIKKVGQSLFAGTANGLVELHLPSFYQNQPRHRRYQSAEGFKGLECNQNAVVVDTAGSIWFGTIKGAYVFHPQKAKAAQSAPKIQIADVKLFNESLGIIPQSQADVVSADAVEFESDENSISFEFQGVSHVNPESITYNTFLENFDEDWSPASNRNIATYTNLPPGNFRFNVVACDKYGHCSPTTSSFSFLIAKPFHTTWWFRLFSIAALLAVGTYLYKRRIKTLLKQEQQNAAIERRISDLRLEALRAQMNPHFIFNSLNSVQRFILANDSDQAARYLGLFSRLIRLILDSSFSSLVTLQQELDTMELYLRLEDFRFQNKFEFHLEVDPDIDTYHTKVPPLVFQPYLENAIWHGLMPLKEKGSIHVRINQVEDTLHCVIEDNGIGRRQSEESKSKDQKRHQSRGMSMNKKRLEIMNELKAFTGISVRIIDLVDDQLRAKGTRVELRMPVTYS